MKRFIKVAFISFGSLIVVFAIALALLPMWYQNTIQVDVERKINQHLEADVSFSHLRLRFYKHFPNLTLSLHDLLVLGKDEFKKDTLALVREAQFEVNIFSLLSKETEIKSIHLVDPLINVYVLKDGHANYNITKPDSVTEIQSSPINIAIDQFSIENGEFNYDDWQRNIFMHASGLEHHGEGNFLNEI